MAAVLAACGGSPGTPPASGGSSNAPSTSPTASDLVVTLSKAAISNNGSDQAKLSVSAVDASRNIVPSVPVSVTVDNNAIFTPSGGATTDGTGTYSGQIGIGADKSNRLIRYTVTSGGVQKTGAVSVSGIVMQSSVTPQVTPPGGNVSLSVTVKDAASAGVSGVTVTATGITGVTLAPQQTNSNGVATFTFVAPSVEGFYTIALASSGQTASTVLQVSSGGSVPAAIGTVSGPSVIANPVVLAANTTGSTTNQAEVRALFYAADNSPIKNMRVRFAVVSTALPGEALTTGANTVYSDVSGVATTSYIAATTNSPTQGVVIRACYDYTDFAAGTCPNSMDAKLTVTSSPISITIGTDNKISKSASGISYVKKYEIQAVDSAGNAKADVPLSAVVDLIGYWKGPSLAPGVAQAPGLPTHIFCLNEDANRNGILDGGENTNQDSPAELTPRKSDVAIAFVNGNKTDANGLANITLTYPQNVGLWEDVRVTVTASVSGSEGATSYSQRLGVSEDDVQNGSFLSPPYGSSLSCTTPN